MIAQQPPYDRTVSDARRGLLLLDEHDHAALVAAYRAFLPVPAGTERHLRGVLDDALKGPGTLVRAQLVFDLGRSFGIERERALRAAIAVEYFHTASLLFDDLPCMDNATERRGRPCAHVVHGEAAATLGALALVNRAYALLWSAFAGLPPERQAEAARLADDCLGVSGILNGQSLDLHFRESDGLAPSVRRIAEGKTVTLLRLTLLLPATLAGRPAADRDHLARLAHAWGLAYQALDDAKDALLAADATGKTTGRDALLHRPNLLQGLGRDEALNALRDLLAEADRLLEHGAAAPPGGAVAPSRLQETLTCETDRLAAHLRHRTAA